MTDWSPPPGPPEHQPGYPPPQPGYPPPTPSQYPPTGYTAPPSGYTAPPSGYTTPPHQYMPSVDPLISQDFNGWWSRGIAIARRGWRPLAALQGAGVVLALLVQAPLGVYATLESNRIEQSVRVTDPDSAALPDLTPLFTVFGLGIAGVLLAVFVQAVVTLATVHIGVSIAVGAPASVGEALRLAGRRVFPLIGWQLLAVPIYIVGVCLCVIPVFYVAAVFLVLPMVVAIERTNAISRCFSLFHRELGASLSRCATILGIAIGTSVVGGLIGSALDVAARSATPGDGGIIVGSVASTLVSAIVGAMVAIVLAPLTLTAYADLRSRQEPIHGVRIAQELGIAPTAAGWPTNPTGYAMPPA